MKWILKACIYSLFAVLPSLTQANQVTARLIAPVESVVPGETLWFGLSLEIADGWNTYWKNAGSTGLPPTLELNDGETEQQSIHYHIYLRALFGYYTLPRLSGLHLRTQGIDSCKGQSELNLDGGILSLPADDIGSDYSNKDGSAGSTKINTRKVGG
jgi:hypothetical protein